jgi:hypothetical protein
MTSSKLQGSLSRPLHGWAEQCSEVQMEADVILFIG